MPFRHRPLLIGGAAAALAMAAVLLLSRGHSAPAGQSPRATPAAATVQTRDSARATPGASLELPSAQLQALRIGRAETRGFPLETQALGSVSFEEDVGVVQAESTLLGAAANLGVSAKELARVRGLGESNGIAQKELEQAIASEESARAALKAAREALRALGKSDAEIDRLIRKGRIEAVPQVAHARKWALANIAESDSVSVHPGQAVSVRVLAHPQRSFQGKVARVYAALDPATHHVAARVQVADPEDRLRPGMLAEFTIRIGEPVDSTALPENGVVREADGSSTVWVTTDRHHFSQREVQTGARSDGWVQITQGVHPGELIVTDGAVFLSNMLAAPPAD